jgi:hypothetical protein
MSIVRKDLKITLTGRKRRKDFAFQVVCSTYKYVPLSNLKNI